jgi:hypothetical protein
MRRRRSFAPPLAPRARTSAPAADATAEQSESQRTRPLDPPKKQVSDIKRLNALASDTAIHAREHVLVPMKPLAPPGEDRAQLALARLLSGFPPGPSHPPSHGGRRRAGGFCSEGGGGIGGGNSSMRSGASSRTAGGAGYGGSSSVLPPLHWGVGVGGGGGEGGDLCEPDDGECSGGGGGPNSPYSRRSDRTVSASEPGDVELMDRAGAAAGGGGGGLGGAARALAERVVSRRGRSQQGPPVVVVGPSPSAPNLGAMLHRLSSASNGVADFFSAGQQQAAAATATAPPPTMLPPLPRRASASNAGGGGQGGGTLLRQLSTAFGTTALATVDALTRAASQPALGSGGGLPTRKRD